MNMMGQFGDTTLTKVFVGGLAWETPKEALRDHFEKYGDILEAVIICDKLTSRSKGYGFVTFKEPESAKNACEEATPMINGRRANCNLASLGARRPRVITSAPSTQQGSNNGSRSSTPPMPAANQVQWYYPTATPASPYHHAVPVHYGYSPTYIPANYSYNQKLNYTSGSQMNGHYPQQQVYPGGQAAAGTMVPVPYPYYQQFYQQTVGVPAHMAGPISAVPTLISKPSSNTDIAVGKQMVGDMEKEA
ncbi:hypothetical protein MKW98_020126 [Papaver atlanticum]|uniref:RRM domain-containing protein n=1 Tax=Papaver atlanticum TaxID=357466 RepID=A0AAD4S199_9MAGN|nr:hypothetical protein MKW98_020126 [Papaver atlanticum]